MLSSRTEGPKAGPKGRNLEVGAWRAPRLLVNTYCRKERHQLQIQRGAEKQDGCSWEYLQVGLVTVIEEKGKQVKVLCQSLWRPAQQHTLLGHIRVFGIETHHIGSEREAVGGGG